MLSLTIDEQDAIEILRRVRHQRGLREVDLREPDPSPDPFTRGRIAATSRVQSGFVFSCVCGREITTQAKTGECSGCGTPFDITYWGQ